MLVMIGFVIALNRDNPANRVIRVPIYAASSWTSIVSLKASLWLDPIRDVYEVHMFYNNQSGLSLNVNVPTHIGLYDLHLFPAAHQLSRG